MTRWSLTFPTSSALLLSVFLALSAQAMPFPNPPPMRKLGEIEKSQILSSLLSTASLTSVENLDHQVSFNLADGTHLTGLLFFDASQGLRPLLVSDFGLMSSRTSGVGADFIKHIVKTGILKANFLILDDITGASFYAQNNSLSLGGYDAGRILVLLADELARLRVPMSSLHLMGQSLGGLAVLNALIEDERLGGYRFQSAITFSGVIDESRSTASVMDAFNHPISGISGPNISLVGRAFLDGNLEGFDHLVTSINPNAPTTPLKTAGAFFYNSFQERLASLRLLPPVPPLYEGWNPKVSRASVESYLATSTALIGQIGSIRAPIIMVHAQNDPVVDYEQFAVFAEAMLRNPRILTLGTEDGSHCGFIATYGTPWMDEMVNRALQLK